MNAESSNKSESGTLRAIRLGGEWFLNNQDDSFLYYAYDHICGDEQSPRVNRNHSARELGALWAITTLERFLGDPRYRDLGERGLQHFLAHLHFNKPGRFLFVGITPHKTKLSYNAFLVLALLALDHPQKDKLLAGLVRGMLMQQKPDGSYATFFFSDRATGVDYYPGQALLALAHYFEATEQAHCLRSAQRALPFYRNLWRESGSTAFIPWQSQAFHKFFTLTQDSTMAEFVFEMNDALVTVVERNLEADGGLAASLGVVGAVYAEGLNRAYEVADACGDTTRKARYAEAIQACLPPVLTLQSPRADERLEDLPSPAIGGFVSRRGRTDMRVDHNQHAVMALMGAYELGLMP